ncbi:MAG TPA: putative baseplate assembly protein [Thermoanaerobaculia bacterium]|nr:putative baseplate assembly protein [Thermoanaerobaculia bacterium]
MLITNRPGLSAIAYRCGTHPSWKNSLLAALSGTNNPLSGKLTTRDDDDFSIALLDAWATVSDVLTFYQERIANESYLRTARERLSMVELARLIGYELAPAVAAETMLAFTIDGDATKQSGSDIVTIDAGTRVQSVPGQNETPQTFETSATLDARAEWSKIKVWPAGDTKIESMETYLDGTVTNLKKGDALIFWPAGDVRLITDTSPDFDNDRTQVTWEPALVTTQTSVSAMRVAAPLFGHNSPKPPILPPNVPKQLEPDTGNKDPEWNFLFKNKTVYLDGSHPEVRKGSTLVLMKPDGTQRRFSVDSANIISLSRYAVSGKATQIVVVSDTDLSDFAGDNYRQTIAYTANEALSLAYWPRWIVTGQAIELSTAITSFNGKRDIIISGPKYNSLTQITEPAVVDSVSNDNGRSTLNLVSGVTGSFDATKAVVYANVIAATHGESVKQVLGSGDATQPFQQFTLARAPLTYIHSSSSPRGAVSTLSPPPGTSMGLYANDLRWKEEPTLYGASSRGRVFRITRDDEEKSTVRFGDGRDQGARLPSGNDNIRAVYRVGAGAIGNVRAGQLTLLMTQPFGVKEVTNPQPAEGGVDPEVFADARRNAPRTVLTIDRVVSLRDYEAFTAAFQGIGKALATWAWLGNSREVFLSVAGAAGEAISATNPLRRDLLGALRRFGKPNVPIRIESYLPVKFRVSARLKLDPDAVATVVMSDVQKALTDAFSFDARTFGQAVSLSEVESVIQGVSGIVFVDVNTLYRAGLPPPPSKRLTAAPPKIKSDGSLQAAEILTIDDWSLLDIKSMEIA